MTERSALAEIAVEILGIFDRPIVDDAEAAEAFGRLRDLLDDQVDLEEQLFDTKDLALRWGVSREKVRELIESRELRALNVAGGTVPRWRVLERWAVDFERSRSNLATVQARREADPAPAGPGRFR